MRSAAAKPWLGRDDDRMLCVRSRSIPQNSLPDTRARWSPRAQASLSRHPADRSTSRGHGRQTCTGTAPALSCLPGLTCSIIASCAFCCLVPALSILLLPLDRPKSLKQNERRATVHAMRTHAPACTDLSFFFFLHSSAPQPSADPILAPRCQAHKIIVHGNARALLQADDLSVFRCPAGRSRTYCTWPRLEPGPAAAAGTRTHIHP